MVLLNFDLSARGVLSHRSFWWVNQWGGPPCWLASEQEDAGLVLIPPFESTYRTVTRVPIFLGDRFINLDRIVGMKEPLLIVHGTVDEAIPYG